MKKRALYKKNRSGITGVFWNKSTVRWHPQMKYQGKTYHLGSWDIFKYATAMPKKVEELLLEKEKEIKENYRKVLLEQQLA